MEIAKNTGELQRQQGDGVLWLKLNRPQALNSLTLSLVDALTTAITDAQCDPDVRVIVLTGEGRAFCAGADLKDPARSRPESGAEFVKAIGALTELIEACSMPVIAAINGIAVAGGLELVLACDLVIAAESARLGDAHSNYALFPGAGATVRLPRKVGLNNAKLLMFTGDMHPASEWKALGLVNQVFADDGFISAVEALARKLATKSPLVLGRMKQALNDSLDQPLSIGLRYERALSNLHHFSADRVEGLAAFKEKRAPQFKGN
ncbi:MULTISPECIES: enoyl-CoA hydratase/isomerase family protein [Paraburkholderia]|uniref:Enoyl-CoA hydratase/isomerase family protein n=1 Tax=Paraburkholderia podalyriae TaxID=1938811 RepID=A0ABR7Q0J4_9BURK|nr:enoyl-CoA hydratase/isomerase family protein [Paraburkholderia podalyriae]MBC8751939.1 enoyl-CoA hydratase/isomerase family protein [Paraburkholderia podalyriae]